MMKGTFSDWVVTPFEDRLVPAAPGMWHRVVMTKPEMFAVRHFPPPRPMPEASVARFADAAAHTPLNVEVVHEEPIALRPVAGPRGNAAAVDPRSLDAPNINHGTPYAEQTELDDDVSQPMQDEVATAAPTPQGGSMPIVVSDVSLNPDDVPDAMIAEPSIEPRVINEQDDAGVALEQPRSPSAVETITELVDEWLGIPLSGAIVIDPNVLDTAAANVLDALDRFGIDLGEGWSVSDSTMSVGAVAVLTAGAFWWNGRRPRTVEPVPFRVKGLHGFGTD